MPVPDDCSDQIRTYEEAVQWLCKHKFKELHIRALRRLPPIARKPENVEDLVQEFLGIKLRVVQDALDPAKLGAGGWWGFISTCFNNFCSDQADKLSKINTREVCETDMASVSAGNATDSEPPAPGELLDRFAARIAEAESLAELALSPSSEEMDETKLIQSLLECLNQTQRQVILLKYEDGLDDATIAQRVNRAQNSVRVIRCNAMKTLRAKLRATGLACVEERPHD